MSEIKYDTKYFVKIPNREIYLKDNGASEVIFTRFSHDAKNYTKEEAKKIADDLQCVAVERVTTTTIQIDTKII